MIKNSKTKKTNKYTSKRHIKDKKKLVSTRHFQKDIDEQDVEELKQLFDKGKDRSTSKFKSQRYTPYVQKKTNIKDMKFLDLEKFLNSDEEDNRTKRRQMKSSNLKKKNKSPDRSQNTKKKREYSGHKDVVNILHLLEEDQNPDQFADQQKEEKKQKKIDFLKNMEERNKRYLERKKLKDKKLKDELKAKCSFKPKINKKSKRIDKKRINPQMQIPRYEILHELNYVLKEREDQKKQMQEWEQQEKFMANEGKECTFQPKLNHNHQKLKDSQFDISTRHQMWKKRVEQKRNEIKKQNLEKEMQGCTFKPRLNIQ